MASINQMHDWVFGTADGEWASMGIAVPDNKRYWIKKGIIYLFPWTIVKEGRCHVVENLKITENDLIDESNQALSALAN